MEKTKCIAKLVTASLLAAVAAVPAVRAADTADTGGSPKTTQKAGAYIDDSVITAKVKAALVGDKQVSAMKIKVTTKDGVVTLKGAVPSAEVGQHALQLAAGVEGVKDVKSDLTVKGG
jgi:hyperosmotically inducible protein